MLGELAIRNVKRQVSNYLIYFITVSFTVAMLFSMCNMIYSERLLEISERMASMKTGMTALTVLICAIVSCILGYAESYMLKLRKREFGTYLSLGMSRKDIMRIFFIETAILCLIALVVGIVLGLGLFQLLIALVARLMEIPVVFTSYSRKALILTISLVVMMFIISSFSSARFLFKTNISNLLHAEKKRTIPVKHPWLWFLLSVISLGSLVYGFININKALSLAFRPETPDSYISKMIFLSIALLTFGTIVFHISISQCLTLLLLKNKKLKNHETNGFLFRQLSCRLGANSVMNGILAFLLLFCVVGSNVALVQKASTEASIKRMCPFDISWQSTGGQSPISYEEGLKIISSYSEVKSEIPYTIYTSNNDYLSSFTPWSGEGYEGLFDYFIKESEFNRLMDSIGYPTVSLDGKFMVLALTTTAMECDFSEAVLSLYGKQYPFMSKTSEYPLLTFGYFMAVIPDEAAAGMQVNEKYTAIGLKNTDFNATALKDELTYQISTDIGYNIVLNDYTIQKLEILNENSFSAVLIAAVLFISLVMLLMAMAVLALKVLSEIQEDRIRYSILSRLGTDKHTQGKTLNKQIAWVFFLPFILPMLSNIPIALISSKTMELAALPALKSIMIQNSFSVFLLILIVYSLYFNATAQIARRGILES